MGREKGTKRIYDNETREQEKHKREAREKKNLHGDANVFLVLVDILYKRMNQTNAPQARKKKQNAPQARKKIYVLESF